MLLERERIYHDIHDDLGAKLLSILYSAEDETQRQLARDAINDMRSIVSSDSSAMQGDGVDVAGNWHREIRSRCDQAGVKLVWQVSEQIIATPTQEYHLTRVLRELVTNALRHAQCSELTVSAEYLGDRLHIQVIDNGVGINLSRPNESAGNGVFNVRRRIGEIGGEVAWQVGVNGGTQVDLLLAS